MNRRNRLDPMRKTYMLKHFEEHARAQEGTTEDTILLEALDHWVNNPLISPVNKVAMLEEDLQKERNQATLELTALIDAEIIQKETIYTQTKSRKDKQTILSTIEGLKFVQKLITSNIS